LEANPQVIESAVNQRMGYLQQLTGDHEQMDDAQRIIGEISRARLILLDKEKKHSYDKEIVQTLDLLPEESATPPNSVLTIPQTNNPKGSDDPSETSERTQSRKLHGGQSRTLPAKKKSSKTDPEEAISISRPRLLASLVVCAFILCAIATFVLFNGDDDVSQDRPLQGEYPSKNAKKTSKQRLKVVKNRDFEDVENNADISGGRPVPALYRSPDELAVEPPPEGSIPPSTPEISSGGTEEDSALNANPFIIGSKRDDSDTSTPLPAIGLAVTGDIEDRVRVNAINADENEVQFTFDDEGKRQQMSLVGSFNSWDSAATPMQRDGKAWKVTQRLKPIRHEFKFVDGNGDWYPDGDNLSFNLNGQTLSLEPVGVDDENQAQTITAPIEVFGDQEGRVVVTQIGDSIRFAFRNKSPQDYALLLGDFNSWNAAAGAMQRDGESWVVTKTLKPGNYSFKFLGPNDTWYPSGENLSIHFQPIVAPVTNQPIVAENQDTNPDGPPPGPVPQASTADPINLSNQRAREYLSDAGLYEGKPGVWYFPQSNRLVIRQYGRISKDPKIKKALKRLGDRLPNPSEMENPPPRRR
ncbi:MAG: hypothetical protein VX970_10020, partial [Planctomycetota bacterium]|nr:hypothetical protein [Planctomycetota bacterium]